MNISVNGHSCYLYTGGKAFNPAQPSLIMIHGVLNDHSVWILQSRYLAHHGWNVLALDLPGHGRSQGPAPASVEAAADFVLALMDALALPQAALVGHSFGSLIALEATAKAPERVSHLVMVGTAYPMKVSPALLDMSLNQPQQAIHMVNVFSHAMLAPPPSSLGPGTWLYGGTRALMRRVLNSNPQQNLFHTGFKACDDYANGLQSAAKVQCPVLFVLGQSDQMTLPKAAQSLIQALPQSQTVLLSAGHAIMGESPDGMLGALVGFLPKSSPAPAAKHST